MCGHCRMPISPTGGTATTVGRLIAIAIGDVMNYQEWRKYRQCWCPTPQDCSPCLHRMHTKLSLPKAPKCEAPKDVDLSQTRLICPRPSSGLSWYQNIPEFQETFSPKG